MVVRPLCPGVAGLAGACRCRTPHRSGLIEHRQLLGYRGSRPAGTVARQHLRDGAHQQGNGTTMAEGEAVESPGSRCQARPAAARHGWREDPLCASHANTSVWFHGAAVPVCGIHAGHTCAGVPRRSGTPWSYGGGQRRIRSARGAPDETGAPDRRRSQEDREALGAPQPAKRPHDLGAVLTADLDVPRSTAGAPLHDDHDRAAPFEVRLSDDARVSTTSRGRIRRTR